VGLGHSPRIVTDGLVLALDGANYKSFKGEATTNEFVDVTWAGDGTDQPGLTKGATLVTNKNLKYRDYTTYLWTPGSSRNCYLNGNGVDISISRTSTVWTFSCYVKREDGAAITSLNVYMYYPSSDGNASGTIESVGNGWYRVSRTRTGTDTYISLAGFTGFSAGYRYYLSGPQLEKKSYATAPTEVNTTRGTTVATGGGWKDLVGSNSGELVNGVRESTDSGGSLVFDGSDDYIDTGSDIVISPDNQGWTAEYWFNTNSASTLQHFNSAENDEFNANWLAIYNSKLAVWNRSPGYWRYGSTTIQSNTWYQAVFVCDSGGTNYRYYINGVREGGDHVNNVWNSTYSSMEVRYIGRYEFSGSYGRYFNGKIAKVSMYNRALSAEEVQQNFNALRGRFGI